MVWWVLGGGLVRDSLGRIFGRVGEDRWGWAGQERPGAWAWCGGGMEAWRAEAVGWKPARTQDGERAEGETLEEGAEAVEARDGGGHVGGVADLLR